MKCLVLFISELQVGMGQMDRQMDGVQHLRGLLGGMATYHTIPYLWVAFASADATQTGAHFAINPTGWNHRGLETGT